MYLFVLYGDATMTNEEIKDELDRIVEDLTFGPLRFGLYMQDVSDLRVRLERISREIEFGCFSD